MGLFSRKPDTEILVVCTANLCRSPMAEGLLREELKLRGLGKHVGVASAGTHVSRPGVAADRRAQRICAREGIDIRKSRARQVVADDFERFHYMLAMDRKNMDWLQVSSNKDYLGSISLMGSWATDGSSDEIQDPYFGSPSGFEDVYRRLYHCIDGFLSTLESDIAGEP